MTQTLGSDRKMILLCIIAAATTVIAGILHITMAPRSISHNLGEGILFLVGGVVQVFWALPVIKRWGRVWQIIGIVGTAVFVILFFSDRMHILPEVNILGGPQNIHPGDFPRNMTGGEFPRGDIPRGEFPRGNAQGGLGFGLNGSALVIEACQIAFIGLYAVLSKMNYRQKK